MFLIGTPALASTLTITSKTWPTSSLGLFWWPHNSLPSFPGDPERDLWWPGFMASCPHTAPATAPSDSSPLLACRTDGLALWGSRQLSCKKCLIRLVQLITNGQLGGAQIQDVRVTAGQPVPPYMGLELGPKPLEGWEHHPGNRSG